MGDHMMPHHLFDMPLEASENIGDQKLLLLKALAEVRVSLASFIRRFRSQLFPIQFVLVGIALWKVQCVIGTRQFSILPSMRKFTTKSSNQDGNSTSSGMFPMRTTGQQTKKVARLGFEVLYIVMNAHRITLMCFNIQAKQHRMETSSRMTARGPL